MGDPELRCRLLMLANILLLPLLGCLYFLGKLRLRVKARKAESSEATSPSLQQPHPSPSSPLQHLGKLRPREGDEESCRRPGGPGERCGGRGPSLPRLPPQLPGPARPPRSSSGSSGCAPRSRPRCQPAPPCPGRRGHSSRPLHPALRAQAGAVYLRPPPPTPEGPLLPAPSTPGCSGP